MIFNDAPCYWTNWKPVGNAYFANWCSTHGYYPTQGACPRCLRHAADIEESAILNAQDKAEDETPTGWLCPRCKAVNAPHLDQCPCAPPGD